MNDIEDRVLNNMKFRQVFKDNLLNNHWLLNYEIGYPDIPEKSSVISGISICPISCAIYYP